MIDFLYNNMEHKLFIILYSILIIYGFYLVLKEKKWYWKKYKRKKLNKRYKTEITLNVDKEEKYMLRNLACDYGYSSIEEFIVSILNNEINREEDYSNEN
mgnify:CR=1 FL=1